MAVGQWARLGTTLVGAALAACTALPCSDGCHSELGAPSGSKAQLVTYRGDDRVEWRELDARARDGIREAVGALVFGKRLRVSEGTVELSAPTNELNGNLCADQRFLPQPAGAWCTAVLVDTDLVLTAAHCVASLSECRDLRVVFDFLYDEDGSLAVTPASVFDCRSLVRPAGADWAAVQLDRPVVGRSPSPFADRPQAGAPALGASHGQGLPLKVDTAGSIVEAQTRTVSVVTDAFAGASGSPLFDEGGGLLALMQEGRIDYARRGRCWVVRDVDPADGVETATIASVVREELCDAGWPSTALCDRPPTCGDGVCSAGESEAPRCDADCPLPACGDALCEVPERDSCPADCAPALAPGVPFEWFCEAPHFGTGDGCNCACGHPDPDCKDRPCDSYGPSNRLEPPSGGNADGSGDTGDAGNTGADASSAPDPGALVDLHGGCALGATSASRGGVPCGFVALVALAALRRTGRRPRRRVAAHHRAAATTTALDRRVLSRHPRTSCIG